MKKNIILLPLKYKKYIFFRMLTLELTTSDILKYIKKSTFPTHQKALIKDDNFGIPMGIFIPTQHKIKTLNQGTFISLLNKPVSTIYIEIISISESTIYIKEIISDFKTFYNTQKVQEHSWTEYYKILENYHQDGYLVTALIYEKTFPFMDKIKIQNILFLDNLEFPLREKQKSISSISLIYDPHIPQAYKEILQIEKILSNNKSLNASIFSLPLTQNSMESIIKNSNIIHFAGHISEQGLQINENEYYIPQGHLLEHLSLFFINACKTYYKFLSNFPNTVPTIFFSQNQIDTKISIDSIVLFYEGLLAGYKIAEILNIPYSYYKGFSNFYIKEGLIYEYL